MSQINLGLIGCGAIGKAVARLLSGFQCTILYNKPNRLDSEQEVELGVQFATLPDLLAGADVVSLHCPLTPDTAGLIDMDALTAMKSTAVLINVARGGVVVEDDLATALRSGAVHAAACDVFETEPLPADSPLLHIENLTVTPHHAAMVADTFAPTVKRMFDNFARLSRGEPLPPLDVVVE